MSFSFPSEYSQLYAEVDMDPKVVLLRKCQCKLYPYQYESLPTPRHIRLLRLYGENDDASIHATLHDYSINNAPMYTAISYRWRSNYPLRALHLNGMRFWARTNLVTLLREIRDLGESRLLWIDAICINQFDVMERNTQVQMMGSIYSKANTVLSWLDLIDGRELRTASELLSNPKNWLYLNFGKLESTVGPGWNAVSKIMEHEYWTRTWIIQEVVGAEQLFLQCESYRMSITIMEDFACWLMIRKSQIGDLNPAWCCLATANCLQLCDHRAKARVSPNARQPLGHNLLRYSSFDCSEPRDRIHALLEISVQLETPITVNYDSTLAHLFVEVLHRLYDFAVVGTREVVGTAVLLYQQLLCEYGSPSDRLASIKAVRASSSMRITPYFRGTVVTEIPNNNKQRFESFRQDCASMRRFLDRSKSYKPDYQLLENIPDTSNPRLTQSEDLDLFAVQTDKLHLEPSPAARFGFSAYPVTAGDEIWQFSNTDFAIILRAQLSSGAGSARFLIVGPAQLYGDSGKSRWNPFSNATEISRLSWQTPMFDNITGRERLWVIDTVDLLRLLLLVTLP